LRRANSRTGFQLTVLNKRLFAYVFTLTYRLMAQTTHPVAGLARITEWKK